MKLQNDPFEAMLVCPVCGDTYVHLEDAKNIDGKDDYKAWAGRGDAIKIPAWCEGGQHKWNIVIGFHKGNSFIHCEVEKQQFETVPFTTLES